MPRRFSGTPMRVRRGFSNYRYYGKKSWRKDGITTAVSRSTIAGKKARRAMIMKMRRRPAGYNRPVTNGGYTGVPYPGRPLRSSGSRGYILKKYGGTLPKDKKLYSLFADNTINWTYADQASTSETTTNPAKQVMWGTRVDATGRNGSTILPTFNMVVHDPTVLQQIVTGINDRSAGLSYKTSKIVVKSYEVTGALTNIENGPIEVWEYRLIARERCNLNAWNNILDSLRDSINGSTVGNTFGSTATNAISGDDFDDLQASTTAAGNAIAQTNIGVTPYQFAALTQYFKISKVTKKLLNPNDRWEFKYKCRKPMIFNNEKWNFGSEPSRDGSALGIANGGLMSGQGFSLFVMKGTWAANSDGDATQKFGIGNGAVGIEYNHRVHYAQLSTHVSNHQIVQDVCGFTRGEAGYMGPVVRNLNLNAISTGPSPPAAGTDVNGPAGLGLEDEKMANDD